MRQLSPLLLSALLAAPALNALGQAGALDPTLAGDGTVSTDFGFATYDEANAIAVQSDYKIVVAGTSGYSGEQDLGIVRYMPGGETDPDFGTAGVAHLSVF